MNKAIEEIKRLTEVNAQHRRGFYLQDVTIQNVADSLLGEAKELQEEPTDIYELADVMVNALQLAIRNGWTLEEIEQAMLYKMSIRFSENKMAGSK